MLPSSTTSPSASGWWSNSTPAPVGQVGGRAGALDQLGQPGDVVGLHVGLEHGGDRRALRLGEGDVVVDQVDVGVDDRELSLALAAEQVGGAGGLVVEQLAEEHRVLQGGRSDRQLTSYQLIA